MNNKFESKYRKLLKKILEKGDYRNDRTGVGSYSLFDLSLKANVSDYFPIITGRKMFPKIFNTEFQWFMNGETNIKRFKDNKVTIWDSWADENDELGPVYGYQMRNFNGEDKDQMKAVINSIISDPDSRRHIISLWNPLQLDQMALPPCYLYFQFFVKDQNLNMFVVQRSGDMFLGIPYDMCLFSSILLYVADQVSLFPNEVSLKIVDAHIYKNQVLSVMEYLEQPIYDLPGYFREADGNIVLDNYKHGKTITAAVAV